MANRLDEIVEVKRREVAALLRSKEAGAHDYPAGRRDFAASIAQQGVRLIAEVKRRSPSRGPIREDIDVEEIARTYERHGAAAISVLTDETFFGGSLTDLRKVRAATRLPVLRKDFVLDEVQLEEARLHGADAVLLIVAVLGRKVGGLLKRCRELELDALVEVHDEAELHVALAEGANIIGINNRDLTKFEVDTDNAHRLKKLIPASCITIAESGIRRRSDVEALDRSGFDGCLVGEKLMRADDPGAAIHTLMGTSTASIREVS